MKKHHTIIIAGAGGIAQAVALILAEWSKVPPTIYIGNRTLSKAKKLAQWIENGITKSCILIPFHISEEGLTKEMKGVFNKGEIILDCLPGTQAPKMAGYAKDYYMHYANLTEYITETQQIIKLAKNATTGFVLQSGLAPGYINVLANHLFLEFCKDYQVHKVDKLEFKVGALTKNAVAPHYYGFTWSPVGVATEYIQDAEVIRDFKKTRLPSLTERATIIIDGITYEDDLTSGGAANLPDALAGKVNILDYKTLRHPGHYPWIQEQINNLATFEKPIEALQQIMEKQIPHIEDDQIILYVAVQGKDKNSILRRREISKQILPQKVGKHQLRAIQTTTATPIIQCAQMLLESRYKGTVLQSDIDPKSFLNGNFIVPVYGNI
ncbi:saccharopine dehydrogenase-like NADP-dependent oxidoreductase [Winogradskyella pacifica]|uniref:Saccharopine dehydrogenase-like NADP-dependent oxidoreductase n=1 Tax=Winogradskyella pacifica TaxID=664642 RepID=A0A3D9LMB9_9FLAO|nr:saccharopine dehydrogenase C-terminal domain-containing protein [Winogradskyella pacifica]REE07724.1 saccharopine dehydrogenase-like NADP-dependent oxidoreductase [Winogradskyella pacifica]